MNEIGDLGFVKQWREMAAEGAKTRSIKLELFKIKFLMKFVLTFIK